MLYVRPWQRQFHQEVHSMKRFGILLMAALFGSALICGCGDEKKPPAKAAAPPAKAEKAAPPAPAEHPKAEPAKPEHPKAETAKPEEPKPEHPKAEHPK
jgi:hypothetical protein